MTPGDVPELSFKVYVLTAVRNVVTGSIFRKTPFYRLSLETSPRIIFNVKGKFGIKPRRVVYCTPYDLVYFLKQHRGSDALDIYVLWKFSWNSYSLRAFHKLLVVWGPHRRSFLCGGRRVSLQKAPITRRKRKISAVAPSMARSLRVHRGKFSTSSAHSSPNL